METDKSKSNILNMENGFNTRVNLYIIRYLYYHMKKADLFMLEGSGKRKISTDIKDCLGMSRQRLDRIFRGTNYLMDVSTAKKISDLFNTDTKYFKKDGELIDILYITQEDWKCYFYRKYPDSVKNFIKSKKEIDQGMEKVENKLKELPEKNYIANHYDTDSALYRIYYYFKTGITFRSISTLNKFLENLELLKISDWKELTDHPDRLKKYIPLLKKHYEYISAYIVCRELEKKD